MNLLSVDTSSDCGSMSLLLDGAAAGEVRLANSVQHSERLFRSIAFLLESSRMTVAEIDVFVAVRGPGSFTGLRVGMAAVEGLAFTSGGKAGAVSSLSALAWQVGPTSSLIAPVLDARRGEVYGSLYRRDGNRLIEVRPAGIATPDAFLDSLPDEPVVFAGSGVKHCFSRELAAPSWSAHMGDPYLAATVAEMTAAGHQEPFEPLYLRAPGAQPTRSRKQPAGEAESRT